MATEQGQLGSPNVQDAFANLGQNKRLVMIGAGVITVILTLVIILLAWSKGNNLGLQEELVKGIDQGRAFEIVSKLKSNGIESKIVESDQPGKVIVTVFEKQFDDAAIVLSRSDLLQNDGFNLFDKTDWAASDYDKRIKQIRAINGDLSRIISRTTGVKWATVRINIPEKQLFSKYESPTTATVQIELEEVDGKLSKTHVKSIINLLVGYVPNLSKSNISIVDTNGFTYSAVEGDEVATTELFEETEKINQSIQKRIEEYLNPLLGQENFIVRVSSEISREKVEQSATTFTDGVIGQEQVGDERAGLIGATSDAGLVGPPAPGSYETDGKGYLRSNRVIQRYPSFEQKNVITPPGTISNISVAVAVNRGVPASVSLKQLQEGIAAITSPSTQANDVKITVAEFAKDSDRLASASKKKDSKNSLAFGGIFNKAGNPIGSISNFFSNLPIWGQIIVGLVGVILVLNVIGSMVRPVPLPQQSTVAQINQARQRQALEDQAPAQLEQGVQQQALIPEMPQRKIQEEKPDIASVLSGLQEAASEKPEFVANRLQLWLEEGSTV